jgi:hypothetical protein
MGGVPRSPCEDNNCENERRSDNGEPSQAAFPIPTIPHAALHVCCKIPIGEVWLGSDRHVANQ